MKRILFLIILLVCAYAVAQAMNPSHPYFIKHLKISVSGRYLLAGRVDDKVIVWDVLNKKQLYAWIATPKHHFSWQAHFTADEKYVVIQQNNFDLLFISLETGKLDKIYPLQAQATTIAFYKDGKRFIWGGEDGRIQYEDMEKKEIKILKVPISRESDMWAGFAGPISQIILSPDEKYFMSATWYDNTFDDYEEIDEPYYHIVKKHSDFWFVKHINLNLWDAQTFQKIHRLKYDETKPYKISGRIWLSFSPDGKTVYASCENMTAYAWNSETGNIKYQFDSPRGFDGSGTLERNRYYSGMAPHQKIINLMDTKSGKLVKEIFFSSLTPVFGQMITHDATNTVFIGTEDGSVSMYRFNPETLELKLYWHPKPVKRGIVKQLDFHATFGRTPEAIEALRERYIQKQEELGFGKKDKRESEFLSENKKT